MSTSTRQTVPAAGGEPVPAAAPVEAPARTLRHWLPLLVLMAATFIYVLDFFVVNVALPAIRSGLGAGSGTVEWVVAGYGLATAVVLVTGGRLGDRYGRRRVFAAGVAAFVVTSAACALAPVPAVLVGARIAQGFAAGLMAPNVLSLLGVVYRGAERVRALSVYGITLGLAGGSGQLLGGLLLHADLAGLGWRTIFWVNVPIGLAALACVRIVPDSRDGRRARLDLGGVVLATAALLAVLVPLVEGRRLGWPWWSWLVLAAAPFLLAAFLRYERRVVARGGSPLLDPALLARRSLVAGLGVQLAFWCQQGASYLFLALYLQDGRGLAPLASGVTFTALVAGYLLTSFRAPALTARYGRRLIAAGAATAATGYALLLAAVALVGTGGPVLVLVPGLAVLGAGQGMCITPLVSTVLAHTEPENAGSVSGLLATVQQVGNAVGVAAFGVVFFGVLPHGYAVAFGASVLVMAVLLLAVAALTRLLPEPGRTP